MFNFFRFASTQLKHVKRGGVRVLFRKIEKLNEHFVCYAFLGLPIFCFLIIIRIIRPLILIRMGNLVGERIGHFAANTELYLCEQSSGINVPSNSYIDIFSISKPVCNKQLEKMWRRVLPHVWPNWLVEPAIRINRLLPCGMLHEIGSNTQHDRDVHNLYEKEPTHLKFTIEEEVFGEKKLRDMGIPKESPFVCITVRDSSYLQFLYPDADLSYHDYRDCNVQNFVLAAESLANKGYYVIRMGAKVKEPMKCVNPNVIDYASNGMRSDFMDIYLGAKCSFCVTNGTGFDAVPMVFRRPLVQVNSVPIGYAYTWGKNPIILFKHHFDTQYMRELTLSEILRSGVEYSLESTEFDHRNIELKENTPQEIKDAVSEMSERLAGTWCAEASDKLSQARFWNIYPTDGVDPYKGRPLHGIISARYSAIYLRNNQWWLQ